ncbi:MAG: putative helicase [Candidatus Rokubacteria bacterium]|nr:putative helicase [Candidatus Rokubacteria bacterium]
MAPLSSEQALREAIAADETRLAAMEEERQQLRSRLDALRSELAALEAPEAARRLPLVPDPSAPETSRTKVALFRQLFRGREDLYPKLWTNTTTRRKGYAPACAKEWVRGVCEKPRVKCGACPNQAFLPVTDQVILDHLQGRHVVGVYPLLTDETCWLLAADFDKSSWAEDVVAFAETCGTAGVPAAVERSRSGQGAHAWFFFAAPVAASLARKMGTYLLTQTMSRRHQLSMDSYDRLFPNQDTLPRGGFGNLIALPLQHGPRQDGNTVFVDDQLTPFPDQWALLASIPRIDPATVERIARDATRAGQVVGVRWSEVDDGDEDVAPWAHAPSRRPAPVRLAGPLPPAIRSVLAQKLFVDKAGLLSQHLNQIKRLAAFQNPEFYKKQGLRLSTALTPRVITCAEDLPEYVALPRGCCEDVETLLRSAGSSLVIDDRRQEGERLDLRFRGELTAVQEQAARALLEHTIGVFVAPPGVGKTVVGAYLVAARARSTLVLVHRQPLLDQWIAQLAMFLGMDPKAIGQIGAGKRVPTRRLDVAMLQSLVREGQVDNVVATYGHVIVDECHHIPAVSFERVLSEVKARFVTGLTATPRRRDGLHPILEMQIGPVRYAVDPKSQAARRPFEQRLIVRETAFTGASLDLNRGIQALYGALAADEQRNRVILDDVIHALKERRSPILLTERKDHLEHLATQLRPFVKHLVVLRGGMTPSERREVAAQLANIPDSEPRLVVATGRYIGEGFDDARLDTLFLTMPVSWKGTLVQYAGRLHRLHPGKTEVRIYDYVDREVPIFLRMFDKRLRGYRAIGYARDPVAFEHDAHSSEVTGNRSSAKTPPVAAPAKGRRITSAGSIRRRRRSARDSESTTDAQD